MKIKAIILFFTLFTTIFSFSALGQGSNFSGEWKLNKEKTVLAEDQLFLSRISINLKNDSLLTTRVYENTNGEEYSFKENLSLDSKECKIVIYDMPRTSKAGQSETDKSLIIESTTTFNGNNGEGNLVSKETWMVDTEGTLLTLTFTNKMSGSEITGTNYYNKVK